STPGAVAGPGPNRHPKRPSPPARGPSAVPPETAMAHGTEKSRNLLQHRPHPRQLPPVHPPRAVLELAALPTAPSRARAWTRQVLWEWQSPVLSDNAGLVVAGL